MTSQPFTLNGAMVVDATCSLVEAVDNANDNAQTNADCPAGLPGRDWLALGAGTHDGPIAVTDDLSIAGAGAGSTTIDGHGLGTVVTVTSGVDVEVSGLTITGGLGAAGASNFLDVRPGGPGGVQNNGTLHLAGVKVVDNAGGPGADGPGGLTGRSATPGGTGGIDNAGVLALLDTLVQANSGGVGGRGANGFVGCSGGCESTPEGGRSGGAGGLHNHGTLHVGTGVTFDVNTGGVGGAGGAGAAGGEFYDCGPNSCSISVPQDGEGGGTGGPGAAYVDDDSTVHASALATFTGKLAEPAGQAELVGSMSAAARTASRAVLVPTVPTTSAGAASS